MRVLILGATGMAGHTISLYFTEAGHDVTTFSRRKFAYCRNILGDAADFGCLRQVIVDGRYDAVINAVGILNGAADANQAQAVLLNAYLPHFLEDVTRDTETKVVQISTDCVFSGKTGGYTEASLKDGETFYDRSKALGELENCKDLTFRNSIIGPDLNPQGIGLFNWFMKQNGQINGYTKAIWSGVTTLMLAKGIEKALDSRLTGIYHLVNNCTISKHELLSLFNRHFKNDQVTIIPRDTFTVDKSIVNTRHDFGFTVPGYEEMVVQMKAWIERHRDLYPHYFEEKGTYFAKIEADDRCGYTARNYQTVGNFKKM